MERKDKSVWDFWGKDCMDKDEDVTANIGVYVCPNSGLAGE